MASKQRAIRLDNFVGGANLASAVNQLRTFQARRMENGVLDEQGAFSKRLGCAAHGSIPGTGTVASRRIISMYVFNIGLAVPYLLVHTNEGRLYYTGNPQDANPTWILITFGFSTSDPLSFETFNGKCYMSNGINDYASFDGTTYTTYPSAPKGKYIKLWKDTMWMSGIPALHDRVYSSAAGDAETWPVANWVDVGKGDGDLQAGLAQDGNFLVTFKRSRTWSIYDPVTFANRIVDVDKGCESHQSIIQVEGQTYFLSRRGFCRYLGDAPSEIISQSLDPMFDSRVINLNYLYLSYGYATGQRVGWAIPEAGSTIPSVQVEYYPHLANQNQRGPWVFQRMPVNSLVRWRSAADEFTFGGQSNGSNFVLVYAPVGTDIGAAFVGMLETSTFDFDLPSNTKYLRRARVLGRGKFNLQIRKDYAPAIVATKLLDLASVPDNWDTTETWSGQWGSDPLVQEQPVNLDVYGRCFTLLFTDGEVGVGRKLVPLGSQDYVLSEGEWALYSTEIEATVLGVRG
jgi:hypothetical protein